MANIRLNIDGREVVVPSGTTIKQAATQNGIDIPTLCYDEKLENYASCGLCVVEVEGMPRLVRACSTEVAQGMIINTRSPRVIESRTTTLELLLSNHTGDCKAPCTLGCPDQVDIQGYVGLTGNGQFLEALKLIKRDLPLPASIGRVCPHPCQTACRRGLLEGAIQIAWIKRFVADIDLASPEPFLPDIKPDSGKRVAIVGGGPSGLSAAYFLRQQGHQVKIFEANNEFGGMLHYGIPMYRLPKDVLHAEIDLIRRMGVEMENNTRLGTDITLKYLRDNYDAIYLAIGAWKTMSTRAPGEDLEGVFGGIHFLTNFAINRPIRTGNTIAVIGGGNTAMDAARTSIRLGAKKVYLIYRRTRDEMPAVDVEVEEAEEEGIEFRYLLSPVEYIGEDGRVKQIKFQRMRPVPAQNGKRANVEPLDGEFETLDVDSVILSIGQQTIPDGLTGVNTSPKGDIIVDPTTFQTNLPGVFAGGDAVDIGEKIAIQAIADGKNAAKVMNSYLLGDLQPLKKTYFVTQQDVKREDLGPVTDMPKAAMEHLLPETRVKSFGEVVAGFTPEEAEYEGNRCLECGCMDYDECDLFTRSNQYPVKPERFFGDKVKLPQRDEHPSIIYDPNKCILCGMCVRICDEVMDNSALGLVDRGFGTAMMPAMKRHLSDTTCISCGQCISVCPVGALQEKRPIHKQVPLHPVVTESACFGCGVGCTMTIETKGDLILRTQPVQTDPVSGGLLCQKGRFNFESYHPSERITQPLIRKDGKLVEVSFDEALLYIGRKAQSGQLLYGSDTLGICISDSYTNEEIFLAKKLAHDVLKTRHFFSFGYRPSGLTATLGCDASTVRFAELGQTELILAVGGDIFSDYTIAGIKIKQAVDGGATLVTVNDKETKLNDWAKQNHMVQDQTDFLRQVIKAIMEYKPQDKIEGYYALQDAVKDVAISEEAASLARQLVDAKKAILVFDKEKTTLSNQILLADIALLSGHIGSPRSGILQLKSNLNGQGIYDMGLAVDHHDETAMIMNGEIKGVISFGEELPPEAIDKLLFLAVQTTHMTETAKRADVILPAATLSESEGFVTSSDRRIQPLRAVAKPLLGMTNFDMFKAIMHTFDSGNQKITQQSILEDISAFNPNYRGIHHHQGETMYWPLKGDVQLFRDGVYQTPSGHAQLIVPVRE